MTGMLYLVEVDVELAHCETWIAWMQAHHLPDVMATECFQRCQWGEILEDRTSTHRRFKMVYTLTDQNAMKTYQDLHAATLQRDHQDRFATVTRARRDLIPLFGCLTNSA